MGDELNRGELIELLNKLGDSSESEILNSARIIHRKVTSAETTWNELLVPDHTDEDELSEDDSWDEDAPSDDDSWDVDSGTETLQDSDSSDALKIIEKLLSGKISDTTREELIGYKDDIAEGDFDKNDLKYLKALSGRIDKN